MGLNRGDQKWPVEIQSLTESVGDSGMPVETWATLYPQVWTAKKEMSGRERFMANQLSTPSTTVWTMDYVADMDPDLVNVPKLRRLVYNGTAYDIVSASHIGRLEGVELVTLVNN